MRTRRSLRNQDILWRALFQPTPRAPLTLDEQIASSEALLASGRLNRLSMAVERRVLAGLLRRKAQRSGNSGQLEPLEEIEEFGKAGR